MITITENAAKYINNYLTKRGKGLGVRLGVKTSGCSGMAYNLEFVDEANEDDLLPLPFLFRSTLCRNKSDFTKAFKALSRILPLLCCTLPPIFSPFV